jgi:hypothetical protein
VKINFSLVSIHPILELLHHNLLEVKLLIARQMRQNALFCGKPARILAAIIFDDAK